MRKTLLQIGLAGFLLVTIFALITPGGVKRARFQTARIEINAQGYQPVNVRLRRGVRARVTFVRTTDLTCAKEIVLPDFNIRRALPLNQPVVISFTPQKKGTFAFVCGMNMMRGQFIVR